MEEKYNINRYMYQIKRLAASKEAPVNSDSDKFARVPHKKKKRNGVIPDRTNKGKKTSNHKGPQCSCVICKKAGMNERKYK